MKRIWVTRAVIFLTAAIAGFTASKYFEGEKKEILSIYTWEDYLSPDLIAKFEEKYKVKVEISSFDSNETMYAKLATGADTYDLVMPSSYVIPSMVKAGMLEKIDPLLTPNVTLNFDKKYGKLVQDVNFEWSVPYAFSYTGIAYSKKRCPKEAIQAAKKSWLAFKKAKRACVFNDMREVIGASMKELGYSVNETDVRKLLRAEAVGKDMISNVIKLDNENWKTGIMSGDFDMTMAYNSDVFQLRNDGCDDIGFVIPEKGTSCCFDEMVVLKKAKHKELAFKFIDFMYDLDNSVENMKYILTVMPVKAIELLPDEFRRNPLITPDKDILAKCERLDSLGDNNMKYVEIWDRMKSSLSDKVEIDTED